MAVKDDVIKAMKEAGKPMSAGEVEKATGIDRKEIDKAFKLFHPTRVSVPIRVRLCCRGPTSACSSRRSCRNEATSPSDP